MKSWSLFGTSHLKRCLTLRTTAAATRYSSFLGPSPPFPLPPPPSSNSSLSPHISPLCTHTKDPSPSTQQPIPSKQASKQKCQSTTQSSCPNQSPKYRNKKPTTRTPYFLSQAPRKCKHIFAHPASSKTSQECKRCTQHSPSKETQYSQTKEQK